MTLSLTLNPLGTVAEDIDIFTGASAGSSDRPNVLIVLDNTANWSRQDQRWPDGSAQGESEARAIIKVLSSIGSDINVGLMEFATDGAADANDAGFIRFPVIQMTADNKFALQTSLNNLLLSNNINDPSEKRPAGAPFGDLGNDMYNYFAGGASLWNNTEKPNKFVHAGGYVDLYKQFKTPLSKANSCAKNYVIFIGNPAPKGPTADSTENLKALDDLKCDTSIINLPNFTSTTTPTTTNLGTTADCYASKTACSTAVEAERVLLGDATYDTKSCDKEYVPAGACTGDDLLYSVLATDNAGSKELGPAATCTANASQCDTSAYAAECSGVGVTCACSNSYQTPNTCSPNNKKKFMVVRTKANTTISNLGYSSACYATPPVYDKADYASQCTDIAKYASGSGCVYGAPTSTGASSCATGTSQYTIIGNSTVTTNTPTGSYDTTGKGGPWHLDEWARCMYQKGMPVKDGDEQASAFYTVDVYNEKPNADHTALLMSAAHQGGGKYFSATNENALVIALKQIFAEIKSVNSTFASASLPVNATNRAQNENQVFIGMFRPDPNMQPRWYGNLKRYQLIFEADGVTVNLGDKNGDVAVNNQTGFIGDCAVSYWTTDSLIDAADPSKGYYWTNGLTNPNSASKCEGLDSSKVYSDSPDGPTVEKGAIAEVIRKGNNPLLDLNDLNNTNIAPTWNVSKRTLYTTSNEFDTGLTAITNAAALDTTQKSWASGVDTQNEDTSTVTTVRASLHGDVVHSRPLPVTYTDGYGVVYYGSNDGMFRAIEAETGKELWALMPFEFAQANFVDRLRKNEPLIKYSGLSDSEYPGYPDKKPEFKTYGWDGSIGIAQNKDNSKVWIYPTMRRGGQMVYALDVQAPSAPEILWKNGCYEGNCTAGFGNMGQSWSAPVVVPVAGYISEKVALFGGGYDNTCEDKDAISPCSEGGKGANIYVVDAGSGTLLKTFSTKYSVVSEVSVVDMNGDNNADYGYVGDTGGNLYRIDMVTRAVSSGVSTYTALAPSAWTIHRIAEAKGNGHKFLFQPALLPLVKDGRVYVAIGSGDREHPLVSNYPYGTVTNRFYVYLDNLALTPGDTSPVDLNTLEDKTTDVGCTSTSILPTTKEVGWYMDLNQYGQGEQTVTSAIILGGQVVFSTNRPIPPAEGTCSTVLGEARGYWVNLFNASGSIGSNTNTCGGDRSAVFVGGGLPPSPVTGNVYIDGKPVTVVIGAVDHDGGASTPISPGKVVPAVNPIRKRIYHKVKGVD